MAFLPIPTIAGDVTPYIGVDIIVSPTGNYGTITRLFLSVTDAPSGGTVVGRIGNAVDYSTQGISTTITDGQFSAVATGSVPLIGGQIYFAIQSNSGSAANLSGWIETDVASDVTAITTAALVKQELNISVATWDDQIDDIVTAVSALIIRECGRDFVSTAYTGEYMSGTGFTDILQVRHYPIISSPAPVLYDSDGATVSTADYAVDYEAGQFVSLVGSWTKGYRNFSTDYTGGYATVPSDLVYAATVQAAHMFAQSAAGGGRSGVIGHSSGLGESQTYLTDALLPSVARTVKRYRSLL